MSSAFITEEDLKEIDQFKEDALFFEESEEKLKKEYPDCWVAVYKKEIAAIDKDLNSLIEKLKKGSIPPTDAVIELLSTKEKVMILFL